MRRGRAFAVAVALLVGALAPVLGSAPATADAGACEGPDGVTVVVDLTDLGGGVSVGCAGTGSMSGLQALQRAGFSVAGTLREGLAFICRIDDRPSAGERLAMAGSSGYREQCVDTPPTEAYWGYWYAAAGGKWVYGTAGPGNHTAIAGGYEGWRFELNRAQGQPPSPAYSPVSRASAAPAAADTSTPSAVAPAVDQGSPLATVLALGGAVVLAVGGGALAWRRSRAR
jgi:hypothetical protein